MTRGQQVIRSLLLFFTYFLIIVTYYVVKPVRGSLVISDLGSMALPYLWVITSVSMGVFVTGYAYLVDRFSREYIFAFTTLFFIVTLLFIRYSLSFGVPWISGVFYIWGEVYSVVMVEQFWTFTNDLFETSEAKKFYGLIGSGGIIGGIFGSALTATIVSQVGTYNLIFVCVGLLSLLACAAFAIQRFSQRLGLRSSQTRSSENSPDLLEGFKLVLRYRYLTLILVSVVLTQVISNLIEFQFNASVEGMHSSMDGRTALIGNFYLWMNVISLISMLGLTPLIHKYAGIRGGLLVLPTVNLIGTLFAVFRPNPGVYFGLKIGDKSLQYSVNRASKEVLYIPTTRSVKYKAKAVIDMFAYRFSRVFGSILIIPVMGFATFEALNIVNACLVSIVFITTLALVKNFSQLERDQQVLGETDLHSLNSGLDLLDSPTPSPA